MQHKACSVLETKADTGTGSFEALVSVFGNVDSQGDRILPGAFKNTLASWRRSGDPIPVILSHLWQDPHAHIGVADPFDVRETSRGLAVKGRLDIEDNDVARQVHRLMKRRSLREFSFGYTVLPGGSKRARDGANELSEIDLIEVGPTLKGANPATELHAVKSALATAADREPELPPLSAAQQRLRAEARAQMLTLLGAGPSGPAAAREHEGKRQMRKLRRQCDQIRLEAALGFDADLIRQVTT